MSIEESFDRIATNLALIAGSISTLAEAVNGTYKGKQIYGGDEKEPTSPPKAPRQPKKTAATVTEQAGSTETKTLAPADAAPESSTGASGSGDLDFFGEDEKPAAKKEEKKAKAATLDNVREKLVEVQTALKHKDHAIALLAKHTVPKGTKALSALPEANYAALIAEGDASIKAGKVAA